MKTNLHRIIIALFIGHINSFAQTNDTISINAGYTNQTYYSLEDGEIKSIALDSWDLAFDASGFGSTVKVNGGAGVELYLYPNGGTSSWSSVDTSGISSWPILYDTDTSWTTSAFNRSTVNDFDLGWGIYSPITHIVTGDSLYVLKLTDGSFRKLWINRLQSGAFHFSYANIDGTDSVGVEFTKSDYTNRNFGYYSILNEEELDLEPDNSSWDLLFTKYIAELSPGSFYSVTGVLANAGITTAELEKVNTSLATSSGLDFHSQINIMGHGWKNFNLSTFGWDIEDSLVYFVEDQNSEEWKAIFNDFGGNSTGKFMFSKEKTSSITTLPQYISSEILVYPNPTRVGQTTYLKGTNISSWVILNVNGQTITTGTSNSLKSETTISPILDPGIYFIQLHTTENEILSKKLIVE